MIVHLEAITREAVSAMPYASRMHPAGAAVTLVLRGCRKRALSKSRAPHDVCFSDVLAWHASLVGAARGRSAAVCMQCVQMYWVASAVVNATAACLGVPPRASVSV